MVAWEGNTVEKKYRVKILLSKVELDSTIVASTYISKLQSRFTNKRLEVLQLEFQVEEELKPPWL